MSSPSTVKFFCGIRAATGQSPTELNLGHIFGLLELKRNDRGLFEWIYVKERRMKA